MENFLRKLGSSFFWEDGRVMIVFAIIIGFLMRIGFRKLCIQTKKEWLAFVPYIIYLISALFGGIMMCMPNGTGNVTQHFYFGILMYSVSSCLSTIVIHLLTR